ncbi:hypothetical protein J32TS6_31460 [Virgibacillus pantothenticus]|uniref:lantibiotic dehydratase n=1 Tax=Virgibacillus pantothenticus TaxID=1473 RepID=UPI001B16801C|nr:lantibiotic dehydratase [Virgibacillus pantothenticus]GIP64591.1 hypothetical protein J32TS6_31460 [Virgibacillus pantothenticus]
MDQLCKKNEEVFGYNFEETKEYIELFCEIGIIEVASYYNDLEEVNPPKIKKISINHNRNEWIKYFNKSKMKIYEDVYLNNIAKIDNSFFPNNTQINVLNKLSLLWDNSVLLKNQFIEYIGKTRKITSYELINSLTDFYKVKDKITNTQLADIISIREEIINMVKENTNNCMETDLSIKKVNELYMRLNYYSKMPISYTYFLQPNLDNSYVLNKVFSGYGRMFSKFQSDDNVVNIKNMHRNSLEHLEEEVKYLDLYGIYGFNANVHQTVTDYILDIENIWGGYELKDLSLAVDFERKELSFYLENKRVFPITLGAISSRMLPLFHRFLCDVNHIDSMDLDLNRRFIYSDWYELSSDKIKFIPRVKAKDIILARNKWLINLSRYNSLKDESKFYSELIRDIEANLIPGEFYVKPIDVKEISNVEQMNDFFKPQFININNII